MLYSPSARWFEIKALPTKAGFAMEAQEQRSLFSEVGSRQSALYTLYRKKRDA